MVHTSPMRAKRSNTVPLVNMNDPDGFSVKLSTEQQNFQNFATTNLKQRECSFLIPSAGAATLAVTEDTMCGCGAPFDQHETGAVRHPDPIAKWNSDFHTRIKPCDSFGDIDFTGFGNRTTQSPYARIDKDTNTELLSTLLYDVWKLPPPKLVVSVTGGAKKFFMKPRLKTAFKQGLIDVASTTDAWIMTGGTATGVMKYVGEALHEYQLSGMAEQKKIVSLGIASWGCIDNNCNLRSDDGTGLFPAMYSLRDCKSGVTPLDHNHSHFLLVDDGTANKYGREIALRARLEEYISKSSSMTISTSTSETNRLQTPVVLIVCEGGVNTLEQTSKATKNKIATLIVKRSGRAADVIAEAYKMTRTKHGDESNFGHNFDKEVTRLLTEFLGMDQNKDPSKVKVAIGHIRQILEDRRMVTIFELDDSNCKDMDKAVLSALLKGIVAQKSNAQSQVDLALIWNRADIARQQIFTLENRAQWQHLELETAMMNALNCGSTDFVLLFLDNGVHLSKFLTINRLKKLYRECLADSQRTMSTILNRLLRRIKIYDHFCGVITAGCNRIQDDNADEQILLAVGRVIQMLLHFKFDSPYENPRYTEEYQDNDVEASVRKSMNASFQRGASLRMAKRNQFEVPSKELFLWAILFDHRDLSHNFLKMSNDPLGGTLVACGILKSLSKKAAHQEEIDLSKELLKEAEYYETWACGILTTCYHMNKSLSHDLLTRELNQWGHTTLFSLAETAQLMEFMRLTCCQTKLNKIWFGRMVEYTQDWKIVLVMFCPFLIHLIKFKAADAEYTVSSEEGDRKRSVAPAKFKQQSVKHKVLPVGSPFSKKREEASINAMSAIYHFYTAPITKFYVDGAAYMAFLSLFTFVVLSDMKTVATSIREHRFEFACELLLWIWAITLFLEEIRQILHREAKSLLYKYLNHLQNFWNQVDFLMFALFVTSMSLRCNENEASKGITSSRITYALALLLAFMRNMEAFYVFKAIGPKIIMIQKMLKDLIFFIVILAVFILSFGVAMQSLLRTEDDFTFGSLVNAVYTPYWQIFGELFIERAEGECSTPDAAVRMGIETKDNGCPNVSWLVPTLSAIYMMLTNVLLLNLLIAMFSYTFQTVQDNSEQVWRFYRFQAVFSYYDSPTLPAPFMIFNLIKRGMAYCWRKASNKSPPISSFREQLSNESNMKLSAFERAGMERYLARKQRLSHEQMDARVAHTGLRIDKVVEDLEDIKEQLITGESILYTSSQDTKHDKNDQRLSEEERMKLLEEKVDYQSRLLKDLINVLRQN